MTFSDALQHVNGFRYMMEHLDLQSPIGRRALKSLPFMTDGDAINRVLTDVQDVLDLQHDASSQKGLSLLTSKLSQLKDVINTMKLLAQGVVLDDIQLFELKHFAILTSEIVVLCNTLDLHITTFPSLEDVIDLLDPEKKRIPHFYIYDAYSPKLASWRTNFAALSPSDENRDFLYRQIEQEEDVVRAHLSKSLREYTACLFDMDTAIATVDIAVAKASMAIRLNLTKPRLSEDATSYKGLFHPVVKHVLARKGQNYQPIDVDVYEAPTVIVGANMSGKSVLLKSVALSQVLMQFGFFVPACQASIRIVDDVYISIGDEQNEQAGLSSFAAEIVRLNDLVLRIEKGERLLVVIDELARTTNPEEGSAIVSGIVDYLAKHRVMSLLTTHYTVSVESRKLRVKGFQGALNKDIKMSAASLTEFMDYSLEETNHNQPPHEALLVAELLGVKQELLQTMTSYLQNKYNN